MYFSSILFTVKTRLQTDIVIGERTFPCHKVILCAMSPYFEAMFYHDMRENRDGVVKLHDIDEDIFGKILEFLYTGKDVV
jgi:hypothetical protein